MKTRPIFTVKNVHTFSEIDNCIDCMNDLSGYRVRYDVTSDRCIDVYSHGGMINKLRELGYVCEKR